MKKFDPIHSISWRARAVGRWTYDLLSALPPARALNRTLLRALSRPDRLKAQRSALLKSVFVEVTNICNAQCVFCAYPKNKDAKVVMTVDHFKKIVDDTVRMGIRRLQLTPNAGEVLADPAFIAKLEYARKAGVEHIEFFTNGILLARPGIADALVRLANLVRISTPGFDPDSYRRVYGVDKCKEALDGTVALAEAKRKASSPIGLHLQFRIDRPFEDVLKDEGMRRLDPYIADGTLIAIDHFSEMDSWSGMITQEELPGTMRLKAYSPPIPGEACRYLYSSPGVMPDGQVRACACWYLETNADDLIIGDAKTEAVGDIIFGKRHADLMQGFMDGNLPKACQACTYYAPMRLNSGQAAGALRLIVG